MSTNALILESPGSSYSDKLSNSFCICPFVWLDWEESSYSKWVSLYSKRTLAHQDNDACQDETLVSKELLTGTTHS